ncbi:MAG TPA: hypothetical protein VGH42_03735 [Verrucomicrobiae bacterium]|jgi:hypothetical protein
MASNVNPAMSAGKKFRGVSMVKKSASDRDLRVGAGQLVHAFRRDDFGIHEPDVLRIIIAEWIAGNDIHVLQQTLEIRRIGAMPSNRHSILWDYAHDKQ